MAASRACQASIAHLTRDGYSETPDSTTSLPILSSSASPLPVIICWKTVNISWTSAAVRPVTASVIIDADALLMAHPLPVKRASATRPSSIRTYTLTRSPHMGLWPAACDPPSIAPKLRGRLLWSRMTSW